MLWVIKKVEDNLGVLEGSGLREQQDTRIGFDSSQSPGTQKPQKRNNENCAGACNIHFRILLVFVYRRVCYVYIYIMCMHCTVCLHIYIYIYAYTHTDTEL